MQAILLFTALVFFASLSAEEKIVGSLENVDLIAEDIFNEDDHNYGEQYFVINRNEHPMRISIKAKDIVNCHDQLVRHTIIVEPHDRADLGSIVQNDLAKLADWKYEWQTKPDK